MHVQRRVQRCPAHRVSRCPAHRVSPIRRTGGAPGQHAGSPGSAAARVETPVGDEGHLRPRERHDRAGLPVGDGRQEATAGPTGSASFGTRTAVVANSLTRAANTFLRPPSPLGGAVRVGAVDALCPPGLPILDPRPPWEPSSRGPRPCRRVAAV